MATEQTWTEKLRSTFGNGTATTTTPVSTTWLDQVKESISTCAGRAQEAFTTCLSTVHEKTNELVVGTQPGPAAEVEEALHKAEAKGQAAAASASTEASQALESTKGAMQKGMEEAQAAVKSAKAGGA
eukprot:Skav210085  [mRNA]  locus=scaffold1510:145499:145882:+ [translate_table: standard]